MYIHVYTGPIPDSMGQLGQLKLLVLWQNQLSGMWIAFVGIYVYLNMHDR